MGDIDPDLIAALGNLMGVDPTKAVDTGEKKKEDGVAKEDFKRRLEKFEMLVNDSTR